jgi:hypothetical protein
MSPHRLRCGIDVCAFTAMVNKTFNKSVPYEDFELMNEATVYEVKSKNQANNKRSRGNSEDQNPMTVMMMMSLLLQARNKNQVLNLSSQLVMWKVTMTMRTMIIKIMMMLLMKMKDMMVIKLTRMMMIKYDKNEYE